MCSRVERPSAGLLRTQLRSLLRLLSGRVTAGHHPARERGGNLRIEAVAGQQGICPLAPLPWVGDSCQRRCVSLNQCLGGGHVGIIGSTWIGATRLHRAVDGRPIDALDLELAPERPLAARAGSIPRLDPRLRECDVVEDAEPKELLDCALDELGAIAGLREPPPHLGDRPLPHLEEAERRCQHDLRIVDLGVPGAFLRK
jgi:hypothetical protein